MTGLLITNSKCRLDCSGVRIYFEEDMMGKIIECIEFNKNRFIDVDEFYLITSWPDRNIYKFKYFDGKIKQLNVWKDMSRKTSEPINDFIFTVDSEYNCDIKYIKELNILDSTKKKLYDHIRDNMASYKYVKVLSFSVYDGLVNERNVVWDNDTSADDMFVIKSKNVADRISTKKINGTLLSKVEYIKGVMFDLYFGDCAFVITNSELIEYESCYDRYGNDDIRKNFIYYGASHTMLEIHGVDEDNGLPNVIMLVANNHIDSCSNILNAESLLKMAELATNYVKNCHSKFTIKSIDVKVFSNTGLIMAVLLNDGLIKKFNK